jgi:hypothetical protein
MAENDSAVGESTVAQRAGAGVPGFQEKFAIRAALPGRRMVGSDTGFV